MKKMGWKYCKLGDVGTFQRGGIFKKADFVDNGFPCIHYGQIHTTFGVSTETHLSSVPIDLVNKKKCAKKGDLIIAITSEDEECSCKCTAWLGDYDVYVGGHTAIFRHDLNPVFMSYYFRSPQFNKLKLEYTHGFKVVEINPKDIAKIQIAYPVSRIDQQQIVEYLDTTFEKIDRIKEKAEKKIEDAKGLFQAALNEKLKKQNKFEIKKLGDIANIIHGRNQKDVESSNGKYPIYGSGGTIMGYANKFLCEEGTTILGRKGTIDKPLFIKTKFWNVDTAFGIVAKDIVNKKFLYYIVKNNDWAKLNTGTTLPSLTQTVVRNVDVIVPPFATQQQIVTDLDALNEKTNAIEHSCRQIISECDNLKQAILKQVFE